MLYCGKLRVMRIMRVPGTALPRDRPIAAADVEFRPTRMAPQPCAHDKVLRGEMFSTL